MFNLTNIFKDYASYKVSFWGSLETCSLNTHNFQLEKNPTFSHHIDVMYWITEIPLHHKFVVHTSYSATDISVSELYDPKSSSRQKMYEIKF